MKIEMKPLDWEATLIAEAEIALSDNALWRQRFRQSKTIHLAVFAEPYLEYVLEGKKTVESRFSKNQCAPYNQIGIGDVVLLKRTGGPIVGMCEVAHVWSYELDPKSWQEIQTNFSAQICALDPSFWHSRIGKSFATLMLIRNVTVIQPLHCFKRDRRGWVVMHQDSLQLSLQLDDI